VTEEQIIRKRLAKGYGTEDIVVMDRICLQKVRFVIRKLRATGILEAIYRV
jgi:hypothetical protein